MEQRPDNSNDRKYYLFALRIAGDFGASIAIPVVVLVLAGRWIDGKYHTGFTYTIAGFVLAALISGKIIYDKAKRYGKEYQSLVDKSK
jgi:hypothetical protein